MRIVLSLLAAGLASLALTACTGSRTAVTTAALAPPAAPVKRAVAVQQVKPNPNAALNGRWEPTDADGRKLYYLQLRNGGLASRNPTGNKTTARGTYKVNGNKVAITYQSALSSAPVNLTCSLSGQTRMTCSSADGSNTFSIVKAA